MSHSIECWKCGLDVSTLPLPLSRRAACPACESDLHVCRLCEFYDTSMAKSCGEPIAEEVLDKERANFCGYFKPASGAHRAGGQAQESRQKLAGLFGLGEQDAGASSDPDPEALLEQRRREADAARSELDRLFGADED